MAELILDAFIAPAHPEISKRLPAASTTWRTEFLTASGFYFFGFASIAFVLEVIFRLLQIRS
jgi:hypothetical protein